MALFRSASKESVAVEAAPTNQVRTKTPAARPEVAAGQPQQQAQARPQMANTPTKPKVAARVMQNSNEEIISALRDHTRLAEVVFADIYLSTSPDVLTMVRNLRPALFAFSPGTKGLIPVPENLQADADRLLEIVETFWRENDYQREFRVHHDGHTYRCGLIGRPGELREEDDTAFDEDGVTGYHTWCLRQIKKVATFEELKTESWLQSDVRSLVHSRGLMLVSGPFASGKSTLCSTAFDDWVSSSNDFGVTIEDPIEMPMERTTPDRGMIRQIDVTGRSVKEAMKLARRWSPRYIYVGEIRTPEIAEELLHMADAGPMVVTTIHAKDAVSAVQSLYTYACQAMDEVMARGMIESTLKQVVYQEIVSGTVRLQTGKLHGPENHSARQKIIHGNFRGLVEDFERQRINRTK